MSDARQLRRIGLIGGIGWPSTRDYYVQLNQAVARRAGGLRGADLVLRSLDFDAVLQAADRPGAVEDIFGAAAHELQAAGARVLGVCANTGHLFCAGLRAQQSMEFIGMDDALGDALAAAQVEEAFLLGTRRLLRSPLFPQALAARGVRARLPGEALQDQLDQAIFAELEHGVVGPLSLAAMEAVARELAAEGARHVVLACTELPPAVAARPLPFTLWDTLQLHTDALVEAAFRG
ncbi:MAG: aspartate/glutamate racemase family protein [Pseudomonadota bacterium]